MSLFKAELDKIKLIEFLPIIIVLFLIQYVLNLFNIIYVDSFWIYIVLILYIIYRLRGNYPDKHDFSEIFYKNNLQLIVYIVILNIFISYGFLYLSNELLTVYNYINASNSFIGMGLLTTVIVSPIAEELIFRGIFLNRLQHIVPTLFAVLISSILFASLHSYGSIISAFIFGISMAVLYLKTHNVLIPIFAHFLNNLIAEIIVFIDSDKLIFFNSGIVLVISVMAIISFILISRFIFKELKNL